MTDQRITKAGMQAFVREIEWEAVISGRPENGSRGLHQNEPWQHLRERIGLQRLEYGDLLRLRVEYLSTRRKQAEGDDAIERGIRRDLIAAEADLLNHDDQQAAKDRGLVHQKTPDLAETKAEEQGDAEEFAPSGGLPD